MRAVGGDDSAINACTATMTFVTRFGLWFSTSYSRLQTEKGENELEGEGVGGLYPFCSAFPCKFFRTICPPEPCFFIFPCRSPPCRSVFTAVFFVCPPCISLHSCRVRRSRLSFRLLSSTANATLFHFFFPIPIVLKCIPFPFPGCLPSFSE